MTPPPDTFITRRVFTDSDEAAASTGSEVEYALLGPQQRDWTVTQLRLGDITLSTGETGAAFSAMGATTSKVHTFQIPLTHSPRWTVNGRYLTPDSLTCFVPGADHVAAIGHPVEWAALQMTPEAFEPIFEACHGRDFPRPSPVAIFHPSSDAFAALQSAIRAANQCARARPELMANEAIRNTLRKVLLDALLAVFPSATSSEASPYPELRLRTHEFLKDHGDEPVYVADLCKFLAVSERSLRRLFREVFGTSPAHYLRVRRFHLARRALKDPLRVDASVTDISTAFGFFDLGRFASDYRALFGELPSQTLASRRR